MRFLLCLSLTVLVTSCSAITDLDDYEVVGGQTDGGGDAGADGATDSAMPPECGAGVTFSELTPARLSVTDWPVDEPELVWVSLHVIGRPDNREALEIVFSALLIDLRQASRRFTARDAILPGQHSAFAIAELNGIGGYQGATFCARPGAPDGCVPDLAWQPELCSDGRISLAPPGPDTNIDIGEQFEAVGEVGGIYAMFFNGFGTAHGGNPFELAIVSRSGRTNAFFHQGQIPADDPFFAFFPSLLPPGTGYEARMFADGLGGNNINGMFDPGGAADHSWRLGFTVTAGRSTDFDPDPRLSPSEEGLPIFTHGAPFDEVNADQWPLRYD